MNGSGYSFEDGSTRWKYAYKTRHQRERRQMARWRHEGHSSVHTLCAFCDSEDTRKASPCGLCCCPCLLYQAALGCQVRAGQRGLPLLLRLKCSTNVVRPAGHDRSRQGARDSRAVREKTETESLHGGGGAGGGFQAVCWPRQKAKKVIECWWEAGRWNQTRRRRRRHVRHRRPSRFLQRGNRCEPRRKQ
ncbi:uncharacterized protein [Dermacentor albipictus]|uniref:uncharacterized protein n=1 Tax=Dermacentor albipictus TaxID=60249 RepID=UPI0038FC591F